jgi:MFS family permease
MAAFEPADNLRSRTFLGLLVAQFLAAFNDQAIHASAMFFAIKQGAMDEAQAISLMPILFYAPWALFCTLSGYFADRYSKRHSLVIWKFAEVLITAIALLGFWMGDNGSRAGPWIVLSTVFLMGTHSAFFVPAKYGAMPEILTARMLSRGNGVLESLSFLAIILGTVFGGVLSHEFDHREFVIGIILFVLAVIGALASLFIRKMPAANPERRFPPYLYKPLWENVRALLKSRPLAFAVLGIAFFTFIVAFMRATVYMHGESQVPRWSESKTSLIVGMVALGIGLGSPLVGFLSGGKVELGLLPIGALGMIVATVVAAVTLQYIPGLIVCIVLIGFFTGFYIVPLFTLLQHRAPKTSKGDAIATSNFINVTGAILASLVFYGMDWAARQTGVAPKIEQKDRLNRQGEVLVRELKSVEYNSEGRLQRVVFVGSGRPLSSAASTVGLLAMPTGPWLAASASIPERIRALEQTDTDEIEVGERTLIDAFKTPLHRGDRVVESRYQRGGVTHHRLRREGDPMTEVYDKHDMPRLLFLSAGGMTLVTLLLLWWQMPGLFGRTRLWFRWLGRYTLEPVGTSHVPSDGAVILATNADRTDACLQVVSATDRQTYFVLPAPGRAEWNGEVDRAAAALGRGNLVGVPVQPAPEGAPVTGAARAEAVAVKEQVVGITPELCVESEQVLGALLLRPCVLLPVWVEEVSNNGRPKVYVVFGAAVAERSVSAVREALRRTGDEFRAMLKEGTLPVTEH